MPKNDTINIMVFERRHRKTDYNIPIGAVGDVNGYMADGAYNNTNASGYINKKRITQRHREIELEHFNDNSGEGCYYDPPPDGFFD